ncbi:hypothetical protein BU24DRAFT_405728 [Aaosphaeria arxii CBS 175.79]|uniref:Lytic polysaccharide monooxygenase n=1 Tax=Aaosphaeria arxii CBS 175.79 TaxID=1450172 RepID=A0A6A5Y0E3_9PLEO|nr:uncharacterized protein BU24DRAFT_405728 [Aaosphaeria arxii CBS 175.79]KAF2019008.1 hypothetical protein BU24DRAFT_405728 [Aaosphaeria arxii CBS 175.79]
MLFRNYRLALLSAISVSIHALVAESLTTVLTTPPGSITTEAPLSPVSTPGPLLPPPVTNNSVFQCWSTWNSARNEEIWADENRTPVIISSTTSVSSYLSWDTSASFTTLCDGFPRAVNPPVATKLVWTTTTDYNASRTEWHRPPQTFPSIDCNICNYCSGCDAIHQFVTYSKSLWSQQPEPRTPSTFDQRIYCSKGTPTPIKTQTPVPFPTAPNDGNCIIRADSDKGTLFYWPVTTVSGDFCAQNGTTVKASPTASDGSPNTAIYNGMTLTSPTAVLIIDAASAQIRVSSRKKSWIRTGTYTSNTLSLHPTAISSVDHRPGKLAVGSILPSYSFNFEDLNTVPQQKYWTAHCKHSGSYDCSRMWEAYVPMVAIPEEFTRLNKEIEFCTAWGSIEPIPVAITAGVSTSVSVTATGWVAQSTEADLEFVAEKAVGSKDGW